MAGNPIATYAPPTILTDGATLSAIDCWNSSQFVVTLGGNRTVPTFINPTGGQRLRLRVIQDATGSRTLTWPSNVAWPAATAPTLTVTASRSDIFEFEYDSAAAVWRGFTIGLNYAA